MGDMGDASGRVSELVYSGSCAKRCGKVGGPNKIWPVRVRWGGYKRRCMEEMGARGCRMAGQGNVPGEAGPDASCIYGCLGVWI